jgi:hypothetical protein
MKMKNKHSVAFVSASALVAGFAQGAMGQVNINTVDVTVGPTEQYDMNLNGDGTTNFMVRFGGKNDTPSTWTSANQPLVDARAAQTSQSAQNNYVLGTVDSGQGGGAVGVPLAEAGTTIGPDYLTAGTLAYLYQDNASVNTTVGGWSPASISDGYIGLMLTSAGGSVTNFGWAELAFNYNGGTNSTIEILRTAYDATPNEALVTPALADAPEPGTMALVGLAGTMLAVGMRSRRK